MVVELIRQVRERGLPVILISHNMPQVFELADRIHIQRLGRRIALVKPSECTMSDAVAIMTGGPGSKEPQGGVTTVYAERLTTHQSVCQVKILKTRPRDVSANVAAVKPDQSGGDEQCSQPG